MRRAFLPLCLLLISPVFADESGPYSYRDDKGSLHLVETLREVPAKFRDKARKTPPIMMQGVTTKTVTVVETKTETHTEISTGTGKSSGNSAEDKRRMINQLCNDRLKPEVEAFAAYQSKLPRGENLTLSQQKEIQQRERQLDESFDRCERELSQSN